MKIPGCCVPPSPPLAVIVLLRLGAAAMGERGISRARPDELVCMDSSLEEAGFEPSVPLVQRAPEWLEKGARALCTWSAEMRARVKCEGGAAILTIEWLDEDQRHARTLYRNPARRE